MPTAIGRLQVTAGRHRAGKIDPEAAAESDSRAHHEEQKPDGQHATSRVPGRRLSYVGIHRLPKSSGTASKGGMAAWVVPV